FHQNLNGVDNQPDLGLIGNIFDSVEFLAQGPNSVVTAVVANQTENPISIPHSSDFGVLNLDEERSETLSV
ncbi:unnamed protein product, partial [Allacma fusca]